MQNPGFEIVTKNLADQIMCMAAQAKDCHYRLVLVVAPAGSGKTVALQCVRENTGASLVNVGLEVARQMLTLTEIQRALQLPKILRGLVNGSGNAMTLLDNTEILFHADLKLNPLLLLQQLSRNRLVVVTWNGIVSRGYLTYAAPNHLEYRRYSVQNLLIVQPGEGGLQACSSFLRK